MRSYRKKEGREEETAWDWLHWGNAQLNAQPCLTPRLWSERHIVLQVQCLRLTLRDSLGLDWKLNRDIFLFNQLVPEYFSNQLFFSRNNIYMWFSYKIQFTKYLSELILQRHMCSTCLLLKIIKRLLPHFTPEVDSFHFHIRFKDYFS